MNSELNTPVIAEAKSTPEQQYAFGLLRLFLGLRTLLAGIEKFLNLERPRTGKSPDSLVPAGNTSDELNHYIEVEVYGQPGK